jgi:hypothetical protein
MLGIIDQGYTMKYALYLIMAFGIMYSEEGKIAIVKVGELENALQIKMEKEPGLNALIKKMEQMNDEIAKLEEDKTGKEDVELNKADAKINMMRQTVGNLYQKIEREKEVILMKTVNEIAGKKYLMVLNSDMENGVIYKRIEIVDITADVKMKLMGTVDAF